MRRKRLVYHLVLVVFAILVFNALELYSQDLEYLNRKGLRILIGWVWWLGNMLDILTTLILVKRFGFDDELNALTHWFMKSFGSVIGLLLFKFIVVNIVYTLDYMAPTRSLILMCTLIVWIVSLANARQIIRLRAQR